LERVNLTLDILKFILLAFIFSGISRRSVEGAAGVHASEATSSTRSEVSAAKENDTFAPWATAPLAGVACLRGAIAHNLQERGFNVFQLATDVALQVHAFPHLSWAEERLTLGRHLAHHYKGVCLELGGVFVVSSGVVELLDAGGKGTWRVVTETTDGSGKQRVNSILLNTGDLSRRWSAKARTGGGSILARFGALERRFGCSARTIDRREAGGSSLTNVGTLSGSLGGIARESSSSDGVDSSLTNVGTVEWRSSRSAHRGSGTPAAISIPREAWAFVTAVHVD
jgi:hypothetical protein